jgi:DNA (cytosine-5)-methyltransferase 1
LNSKSQKSAKHLFPFIWSKQDYPEKNGLKVFTTFACGGGSTMGYKLAGFDVIAANDIDPQMAKIYKHNHNPKYFFEAPIKDLLTQDLPEELHNIDILDGSPPCSVFSMTGSREKAWQKDKHFREGQAKQVLDDLFFDFIELAIKVQPKVIVAENVKGMLIGKAKWYTREVFRRLDEAGYNCQVFLLNAAFMGVPQRRERVFFIASRKDLEMPVLQLGFNEELISYGQVKEYSGRKLNKSKLQYRRWQAREITDYNLGDVTKRVEQKQTNFSTILAHKNRVCNTIVSGSDYIKFHKPEFLSVKELEQIGTFPNDYDYSDIDAKYLIGMSVPPVMMAQVANQIAIQLFNKKGIA